MDTQFNDLSLVDPTCSYYCYDNIQSTGFTQLMKLVLCVEKFPTALELISKWCDDNQNKIDETNDAGYTALMLACANSANGISNNKCIKLLIDKGANVNINNNKFTALYLACAYYEESLYMPNYIGRSDIETVKILLDAGADINAKKYGINIFAHFCTTNNTKLFDIMMCYNPDLSSTDNFGISILSQVCGNTLFNSSSYIAETLIKSGANINSQDNNRSTPLMNACFEHCRSTSIIRLLLDYGADADLANIRNFTALMYFISGSNLTELDVDTLTYLIIKSKNSLLHVNSGNKTSYDLYMEKEYNLLDDFHLKILKGDIWINNTKSAKK